ncbi:MAG: hypothetical protein V3U92_04615 [Cellulophaga sp.]
MISSIFGKTKPINFIILFSYLFVFYWLTHLLLYKKSFEIDGIFAQVAVIIALFSSIFIVDFIVKRNKITGLNSFTILFYVLLITLFPEVLLDFNGIMCSFFLLLSARRLLSLISLRNSKLKIFDATIWIIVASFFYEWASLFLILVFTAIYFYEPKNIRNWLVPIVGVITSFTILTGFLVLSDNMEFLTSHYTFSFELNTVFFLNWGNSTRFIIFVLFAVFMGMFAFLKLGKAGVGRIITMRLISLFFLIGMLFTMLQSTSSFFPLIVTFFPVGIFFANYVDTIKRTNIKEVVLMLSIFAPLMVFVTNLILNK